MIRSAVALVAAAAFWAAVSLSAVADEARSDCITVETARADFARWSFAPVIDIEGADAQALADTLLDPRSPVLRHEIAAIQVWADAAEAHGHILLFGNDGCFLGRAVGKLKPIVDMVRTFEEGI